MKEQRTSLIDEVFEALEIFEYYNIPEQEQRDLFNQTIYFDFTYGDPDPGKQNRYVGVLQFAKLLQICKEINLVIDVNDVLKRPWAFEHSELVHYVTKK